MEGDPGDEDCPALVLPTRDDALQQLVSMKLLEDQSCPIREVCKKKNAGGGARRWIKKATNVITLTWPMVDKNFVCEIQREKGLKWAKKG